jgi:hypothetical protein
MKKAILSLGVVLMSVSAVMAQDKKQGKTPVSSTPGKTVNVPSPTPANPPTATVVTKSANLNPENMAFKTEVHDFGTIAEGPAADYEFTFTNTGKEPIIIQHVQASCGCTTPSYSKDPVLPGKTGTIKASYNTAGRPNAFTKTITITSNAGNKVLTIKGNVEKAPDTSVPQSSSMVKTN